MGKWIIVVLGLVFLVGVASPALTVEGDLTISDREIIERLTRLEAGLTRLEAGQESVQRELGARITGLENRIDDLRVLMYVVLGGMLALIGFVIWDRRSALSPVITRTRELEENRGRTLRILKDYAQRELKIAEVIKSLGLM